MDNVYTYVLAIQAKGRRKISHMHTLVLLMDNTDVARNLIFLFVFILIL